MCLRINTRASAQVAPGKSHRFQLKAQRIEDETGKFGCVEDGENDVLSYFGEYSYFGCMEECISREEIEACGCALFFSILLHRAQRKCEILDLHLCGYQRDASYRTFNIE